MPKTAFCTPWGKFQFNLMPFGLHNTPRKSVKFPKSGKKKNEATEDRQKRCGPSHFVAQAFSSRSPKRQLCVGGRLWNRSAFRLGVGSHLPPRSLASEWLHPTRLETRTKECNTCASLFNNNNRRPLLVLVANPV